MSNNETLKSATDSIPCVPETTNSNAENNIKSPRTTDIDNVVVTSKENQNQPIHGVDTEISSCVNSETSEMPTKEMNIEINKDTKIINETAGEADEKILGDDVTCETKKNEQFPNVPEIRQQTSIGAGDICSVGKPAENDTKPEEKTVRTSVTAEVASVNNKSSADNGNETENEVTISKLKEKVQKTSDERDSYQEKLGSLEKKLATLQQSYDALLKGDGDEIMLRRMIEQLKGKLIQTSLQLEDRIRIVANQEKQISALNSQVASLKEVETLTRSLLQIRNMEVKHLQAEVDDMEVRITEERERYNTMINKMDSAVKLNADLKKEYETQLCLFRDLREKYEEKVTLLSEEKRALEASAPSVVE